MFDELPTHARTHEPVLLREVLEFLNPQPGRVIVDCTVGAGGHSAALLPRLLPNGRIIAIDRDADALERARQRLTEFAPDIDFVHTDFAELPDRLAELGVQRVDGVLADFGVSSVQLDDPSRGFSFQHDSALDMRMDRQQSTTAADLIARLSEAELADIIWRLGEERWSRRIARRIVERRNEQPIRTTQELVQLVVSAMPQSARHGRVHAATRTFQALRIAVNRELESIEQLLASLPSLLSVGARAVMIAFHSLEDRLVKRAFQQAAKAGSARLLVKKPLIASDEEISRNPRARSAKLRAIEWIAP